MAEWKWTYGGKYERSLRVVKKDIPVENFASKETENNAMTQCLLSEEESWGLEQHLQRNQGIMNTGTMKETNRREDTYTRMSEREMMGQIGMNPFHSNNTYMDDLMVQENFLKPISTSIEREKEKNAESR